jgi:hypothetical protein
MARKSKYVRDEKSIELLSAATRALADYRDHIRAKHGSVAWQMFQTREPMLVLKELLREENRGWED